jgi:hypothetical protein
MGNEMLDRMDAQALTKMREFEIHMEVLKIENMKMRVVLKREIGEDVDLSKVCCTWI